MSPDSRTPSDTFIRQEYDLDTIRVDSEGLKTFDVGLALLTADCEDKPLSPGDIRCIRRKVDAHLLPLLCSIYTSKHTALHSDTPLMISAVQWIDKYDQSSL